MPYVVYTQQEKKKKTTEIFHIEFIVIVNYLIVKCNIKFVQY